MATWRWTISSLASNTALMPPCAMNRRSTNLLPITVPGRYGELGSKLCSTMWLMVQPLYQMARLELQEPPEAQAIEPIDREARAARPERLALPLPERHRDGRVRRAIAEELHAPFDPIDLACDPAELALE